LSRAGGEEMTFTLKPVWGDKLVGRESDVVEIFNSVTKNKTGVALYGVRRVGKTSLFYEVERRLKKEQNVKVIYLSLWGLLPSTLENFLLEFFIKVLDIYLPDIKIKFREIMKLDLPSIKKNLEHIKASDELRDKIVYLLNVWKNKEIETYKIAQDIFKLPQKLAEENNCVTVILLDEFPTVLKYEGGKSIVEFLRTLNEKQDRVVYSIAGSERSTMEQVALDANSPFYKQFISKEVRPLDKESVAKFIKSNLAWLKIKDDAINVIYHYSNGLPYHINLVGITIENSRFELKEGSVLDGKTVEKFILRFLKREGSLYYSEEFESLNDQEKHIVGTMALYGASSPSDMERITKKAASYISAYLYRLKKKKIVMQDIHGAYKIRDPMFEQWLKYEFKGLE
jgi:AAA+ ATPase superfamily predicted ATPase